MNTNNLKLPRKPITSKAVYTAVAVYMACIAGFMAMLFQDAKADTFELIQKGMYEVRCDGKLISSHTAEAKAIQTTLNNGGNCIILGPDLSVVTTKSPAVVCPAIPEPVVCPTCPPATVCPAPVVCPAIPEPVVCPAIPEPTVVLNTFKADSAGLIVADAEHYTTRTPASDGVQWELVNPTGSVYGAMQVPDVTATTKEPMLSYTVDFPKAGIYYIWVRGYALSGTADTIHMGLNGVQQPGSSDVRFTPYATWMWSNVRIGTTEKITMDIPTAGTHTVNIMLREDGTIVDRFVMTQDQAYVPTGDGPDETLKTVATTPVTVDTSPEQHRVTLSWAPPKTRTDGTALTVNDISYYVIYATRSDGVKMDPIDVRQVPNQTAYKRSYLLAPGTWSFSVSAIDTKGLESKPSVTVVKGLPK